MLTMAGAQPQGRRLLEDFIIALAPAESTRNWMSYFEVTRKDLIGTIMPARWYNISQNPFENSENTKMIMSSQCLLDNIRDVS